MEDESGLIMLIQHYASRFGITFDSKLMDDEVLKPKLIKLLGDAISGKRGAVTDEDVREAP
ncbi:MAG: hypothetical protein HOP04_05205 [Methylophilaceae bacterium]|nr:hypothetical protein [Methylophilaceae bacterium]